MVTSTTTIAQIVASENLDKCMIILCVEVKCVIERYKSR